MNFKLQRTVIARSPGSHRGKLRDVPARRSALRHAGVAISLTCPKSIPLCPPFLRQAQDRLFTKERGGIRRGAGASLAKALLYGYWRLPFVRACPVLRYGGRQERDFDLHWRPSRRAVPFGNPFPFSNCHPERSEGSRLGGDIVSFFFPYSYILCII
jgi:hypothetical protein